MTALGIIQIILCVLIVASAVSTAFTKDLLVCVLFLAVMSLCLALEYYLLQAPDVAIAEASVGAAIGSGIYILAIRAMKRT
jgi:uncharacterized MnhB-related membrane protein